VLELARDFGPRFPAAGVGLNLVNSATASRSARPLVPGTPGVRKVAFTGSTGCSGQYAYVASQSPTLTGLGSACISAASAVQHHPCYDADIDMASTSAVCLQMGQHF